MAEFHEIIKDIRDGKFATVYFLEGEEPFFIDRVIAEIEATALEESQKSFNEYILYGKESDLSVVIDRSRQFPMMGERQVVIVKEAQSLGGWKDEGKSKLLMDYLARPQGSTILVFGYKYSTLDKRKELAKLMMKHACFLSTKKMYDDKIPGWIQGYAQSINIPITQRAVMLISEHIGNNLQRIANELDKVKVNLKPGQQLDDALVHQFIGINKDYNIFELQRSIGAGNFKNALQIVLYFASNPGANPLIPMLTMLFNYFSKLLLIHESGSQDQGQVARLIGVNPYFVKEYLHASKQYSKAKIVTNMLLIQKTDLKSKGIGFNGSKEKEGELMKDLLFQMMH